MAYNHGVRVLENPTSLTVPIEGSAGLQVIFGTAPVNLAEDPYDATNKPKIAYSFAEAAAAVGYCDDFKHYNICESIDASFRVLAVAPIILVNVLDPKVHRKNMEKQTVTLEEGQATVKCFGILRDTVKIAAGASEVTYSEATLTKKVTHTEDDYAEEIDAEAENPKAEGYYELVDGAYVLTTDETPEAGKSYYSKFTRTVVDEAGTNPKADGLYELTGDVYTPSDDTEIVEGKTYYAANVSEATELTADADYVLTFDDDGYLVITLTDPEAEFTALTVEAKVIDPEAVDYTDIIGGYNVSTGEEKGLEIIRHIFPKLQMTPGLIVCPGWSSNANVAAAIAAKCTGINGLFSCEAIVDLDTGENGARKYTDVFEKKQEAGFINKHLSVEWPCVRIGEKIYHASAIKAAITAQTDAENDDVPNLSPSNKVVGISGLCLEDGTEVVMDEQQANVVNSFGVCTFNNFSGWATWGSNTAIYPASTDPKDRWFNCRRFFSWWGNNFIRTYHQRVDDPNDPRQVQAIVDDENVRGNSYVAQGKCAGFEIEYREADNTTADILNGSAKFLTHLAPYPPMEDILDVLEFDPALLQAAFTGGE